MKRSFLLAPLALAIAVISPGTAFASKKGWADASDVGVYSLMALSVGLPAAKGDWNGALQSAGSMGAASVATEGLKEAFPTLRPDGSDRRSFPSGHTSRSFAAAATLWERQGPEIGISAMVVAGLVGTARMKADKHRFGEVAVGAGIGIAAGMLITNKRSSNDSALVPWSDGKGGGIAFSARF